MILVLSSSALMFGALAAVFFVAPEEASQGWVQKIFYVHVACAFTMYAHFAAAAVTALGYLLNRRLSWDEVSVSAAEVGYLLCSLVLITGPLWARPTWGVWWTWDPRLTAVLILWLLYGAYFLVRMYFTDSNRGRVASAVICVLALLDLPLIHAAVKLWRGIHPSVLRSGEPLPPVMRYVLVFTVAALFLFSLSLFAMRRRIERARNGFAAISLKEREVS